MFILSIFEMSVKVEEAVTALEIEGIPRDKIKAVPMESRNESRRLFDTTHYSDNSSTLSVPFIIAMLGTFWGIILGFQFRLGPIIWGFVGALVGFAIGLVISALVAIKKKRKQRKATTPRVIVIVECQPDQTENVKQVLWTNAAEGLRCLS